MLCRDICAVVYLEYRRLMNFARLTARQPVRALLYGAWLCCFIAAPLLREGSSIVPSIERMPEPYASALGFAYIAILGVLSYAAVTGMTGALCSPADARFLLGSRISDRVIGLWLQLRHSKAAIPRTIVILLLYVWIFGAPSTVLAGMAAIACAAALAAIVPVPIMKLRAAVGAEAARKATICIATLGMVPAALLLCSTVTPPLVPAAAAFERMGLGYAFDILITGNAQALLVMLTCTLTLTVISWRLAGGLYPEIYASSLQPTAVTQHSGYSANGARALHRLRGAWAIAWKEWIYFLRSPRAQQLFLAGAVACGVCGATFGSLIDRSKHPLETVTSLATSLETVIVVIVAMGSAITLGSDLRKPMWSMGDDPLWKRLLAWIAGTSWRIAACLTIGLIACACTMHAPLVAFIGIPLALAAVLQLRGVGLALYAMFPSTIDQHGPLAIVRALLTYLLAVPPIIIGCIIAIIDHAAAAAVGAVILTCIAEALALISYSCSRIAGHGIAIAQAEGL